MDTGKQETKIPIYCQKESAVEGYGRPDNKKQKIQKVGTEPQLHLAWKSQINFIGNLGASSKNFGYIEPSKGPSRAEALSDCPDRTRLRIC